MKVIYISIYLSFSISILTAQYKTSYKCKFTIMEVNEISSKNSITKGEVVYNQDLNQTIMNISFPEKQTWKIIDSTLFRYKNDTLLSMTNAKGLQELSIFKELLNTRSNDFGLRSMGFKESSIIRENGEVIIEWIPSKGYDKFLTKATTSIKNNLLQGVIFTDKENDDISSIFFENYEVISGIPVPLLVKQQVSGQKKSIYKIIKFSNVEID